MTEVVLWVGVYGQGTSFSVSIPINATVEELKTTIVNMKEDVNELFRVDPATVSLYFACEKNEDGSWSNKWLRADSQLISWLKNGRKEDDPYVKMVPSWNLQKQYIQRIDDLGDKVIHILLELPQDTLSQTSTREENLKDVDSLCDRGLSVACMAPENAVPSICPKISVTDLLRQNSLPRMEFMDAMKQQLGFKIPVLTSKYASMWPDSFTEGKPEYGASIDVFLDYQIIGSSKISVLSTHSMWFNVFLTLCQCSIFFDETHESTGQWMRPDAVIAKGCILLGKCEARASLNEMVIAIRELTDKMADAAFTTFPREATSIPAWTACPSYIQLHQLSYSPLTRTYETRVLETYNAFDLDQRRRFVVDLFKILKWMFPIQEPNAVMHLLPEVRTVTTNGHYVTWFKTGLLKEFRSNAEIDMELIQRIYNANLQHVERGRCNYVSITITSIGQTLKNALVDFQGKRDWIIDQVKSALDELHSIGVAHCDVRAANVFVLLSDKRIILGDLEYCRLLHAPPPDVKCFPKNKSCKTALELDNYQFGVFVDELARCSHHGRHSLLN